MNDFCLIRVIKNETSCFLYVHEEIDTGSTKIAYYLSNTVLDE